MQTANPYVRYVSFYNSASNRFVSSSTADFLTDADIEYYYDLLSDTYSDTCTLRLIGANYATQQLKTKYVYSFIFELRVRNSGDADLAIIDVDEGYLSQAIGNLRTTNGFQQVLLLDRDGNVFSSNTVYDDAQEFTQSTYISLDLEQMPELTGASGSFSQTLGDGTSALVTYARSDISGFTILNIVPYSNIFSGLPQIAVLTALAGLIVLAVGIVISYRTSARLSAPIEVHIGVISRVEVLQTVADVDVHLTQAGVEQAVVGGERGFDEDVQPGMHAPLYVGGHIGDAVMVAEQYVESVLAVDHRIGHGGIRSSGLVEGVHPRVGGRVAGRGVEGGVALHDFLSLVAIACRYGNFAVLLVAALHQFDTYQHLVVVADAHGFGDVALQVGAHGAVEARQPVGLIGKDARQREDDEQGDVFRGKFHGDKDTEFILIPTNMVRLNNTLAIYGSWLYSSSVTGSSHSLEVFSPAISKARWANQLSAAAPCQCFTLAGM